MRACRWCGVVASGLALLSVWDAEVQMFVEHYICRRCEAKAIERKKKG
jgi:hypothetical protein